jgi:DNA-3-methyladenine glycosylase I
MQQKSEPSAITNLRRCSWVSNDPDYLRYHDEEWGQPEFDELRLFEQLTLEGAQAGLSWLTVLRKRDGYRQAFEGFDPRRIALFDAQKVDALIKDPSIIRHRGKIESTIINARCLLALWDQGSSLRDLTWGAGKDQPQINRWKSLSEVPTQTEASHRLSKQLKSLGFRFVGPTTVYAYLQAVGAVNDHETACFRHPDRLA